MAETSPPSSHPAAVKLSSSAVLTPTTDDSSQVVTGSSRSKKKRRGKRRKSKQSSDTMLLRWNVDSVGIIDHHPRRATSTTTPSATVMMEQFLQNGRPDITNHAAFTSFLRKLEGAGFFNHKDHERARDLFRKVMQYFGLTVDYALANRWNLHVDDESSGGTEKVLDLSLFRLCETRGVEKDIPAAAKDPENRVHVFSVASQYNCAEASDAFTPAVGKAMRTSENDRTQGPLAQRTNPVLFECVTAFLSHCGYNMMESVLPSAGKTWQSPRLSAIAHGYLRPNDGNLDQLTREMKENYAAFEAPCYQTRLIRDGKELPSSVYLMLGSAPALGYSSLTRDSRELQYYAHLANFAALFGQVKTLLKRFPTKEVVLHVTGIGLGVFGGDLGTFTDAFAKVGWCFQESLSPEDKKRAHVQLESFGNCDALSVVAEGLHLGPTKERLE